MPDEPETTIVENIPSIAGKISGVASANTPFVYFEDAVFYGFVNGVGKVALATNRLIAVGPNGSVLTDPWMALFLWPNQNLRDLVIEPINSGRLVPRSAARFHATAAGTEKRPPTSFATFLYMSKAALALPFPSGGPLGRG